MTDDELYTEVAATPIGFAELVLGLKLYPWQDEAVSWFADPRRMTKGAMVTPNGAGKSSGVVAALALGWLGRFKRGKVLITTKDSKQLDNQLYPALTRHRQALKGWTWVTSPCIEIRSPTGGVIVAFTTNDAGRAEGWHKEDDLTGPLLIIVDEAKSVEETIFQAIDRCTYNGLLYVSSPGLMQGRFYEAFTKHAAQFRKRKVSLTECPHIPAAKIDSIRQMYGDDHPFTKSSVYGEFMDNSEDRFVFSLSALQKAWQDPPRQRIGSRNAFCDFAAGGDENVIALRQGNRITVEDAWRESDTERAVGRFMLNFKRLGLKGPEVWGDDDGLGHNFICAFRSRGVEINPFNGGHAPFDDNYKNRVSEAWHSTSQAVTDCQIILPDDPDGLILQQLTTRKAKIWPSGQLGMESKDDMRKRGIGSPDRADAICGAWACRPIEHTRDVIEEYRQMMGIDDDEQQEGVPSGAWAG